MKITAVESVQKTVLKRTECDRCKKPDTSSGPYSLFDFTLTIEKGENDGYGAQYNQSTTTVDLCEPCAEELKLLLLANGYRLNEED